MIEVVGIGAAGWSSLGPVQQDLVRDAGHVLGGRRHLDLLPAVAGQRRTPWPRDLRAALPDLVVGHEQQPVVVLASGDPLVAGVGSTLVELFGADQVRIHPHVSSVALAAARLGWSAETYAVVRLHADAPDAVRRHLAPQRRLLVLSRDGGTPARVAALLFETGFGASELTVLADLGGPAESVTPYPLTAVPARVTDLHVLAVVAGPDRLSPAWSTSPGLPDEAYAHDGQLTKRDVRASALAHLRPLPGQLLWDLGAGAGSVGIEWARSQPGARSVAVERDPERVARIRANAASLGVPDEVLVVPGAVADVLADLPIPDAVFVGGGGTAEVLTRAFARLAPGGRLVAHAVTLETEAVLIAARRTHGGDLTRLSVETLEPLGGLSGWKPARAVVQWSVQKPLTGVPSGNPASAAVPEGAPRP